MARKEGKELDYDFTFAVARLLESLDHILAIAREVLPDEDYRDLCRDARREERLRNA